ncbi:DUF2510 domain-containing protein [Kitasatospora sp. NPDC052896]|uniref:DUF2510 domain-containing protein n=1 Tax=Kitasatospora sp. NPDC052896 TaxID=3364061 RepID=UPI0037CC9DB6
MNNSTPAGWYPDPDQGAGVGAGVGGGRERYWDGTAWTPRSRPAGGASEAAPPVPARRTGPSQVSDASPAYGHPAVPAPDVTPGAGYGFPHLPGPAGYRFPPPPVPVPGPGFPPPFGAPHPAPPVGPRRRVGLIAAVAAGALTVTAVLVVGTLVLLEGAHQAAGGRPAAAAPTPSAPAVSAASAAPSLPDPDGTVQDAQHDWTVPVPVGWTSAGQAGDPTLQLVTGRYDCTDPNGCYHGTFTIGSSPATGPDARSVAEDATRTGSAQHYGDRTSHQELAAGQATVAGIAGYSVHWQVTPQDGSGPGGFVTVVAVPDGIGGYTTLVGTVDNAPNAPAPAVLDQLLLGIRPTGPRSGI